MSGLTLRLRAPLAERFDLAPLTAGPIGDLSAYQAARLRISSSKREIDLGDVFDLSGEAGETLSIEGGSDKLDFVGAGLTGGHIRVDGDVGLAAGRLMKGGRIDIRGNAGPSLAAGAKGGIIHVTGSAADGACAVQAGERFGLLGAIVVVDGDVGARAGDKMRRGILIVGGKTGESAGARMSGGTIIAARGFGHGAGVMMLRGTLIGPSVDRMLPTFVDCGVHDLVILRVFDRYLAKTLGKLAPQPVAGPRRRIGGDLSTIGKGEILLPVSG